MRTKIVATLLVLGLAGESLAQGNAILRDVRVIQVEPTVVPNRDKVKDESAAGLVEQSLKNALVRSSIEVWRGADSSPYRARGIHRRQRDEALHGRLWRPDAARSTGDWSFRALTARNWPTSGCAFEATSSSARTRTTISKPGRPPRNSTKKLIEEIAKLRGPATATSTAKPRPHPSPLVRRRRRHPPGHHHRPRLPRRQDRRNDAASRGPGASRRLHPRRRPRRLPRRRPRNRPRPQARRRRRPSRVSGPNR